MTQEKILTLALTEAIRVWREFKDRAKRLPDNESAKRNEQQKWKEVQELKKMLKKITETK